MEPDIIDWDNIDSVFIEDEIYEHLDAPKWVDFSAPEDHIDDDDDAWFCNSRCKHPKTAEDYQKSSRSFKAKLLRSFTITEKLPLRDRPCRDAKTRQEETLKTQKLGTKESTIAKDFNKDGENQNPNLSCPLPDNNKPSKQGTTKSSNRKKEDQLDGFDGNSVSRGLKGPFSARSLKSSFSARNLLTGRKEALNQIKEFYSDLKRFGRKVYKSKRESMEKDSGAVLGEVKDRVPLLEVKDNQAVK